MTTDIALSHYKASLFRMLDETFENVQSMYLDRGTSLFETLESVPAEVASQPVSATCASIAGQVDHTRFYLEVMIRFARGEEVEEIDWDASWQTVSVTDAEWKELKGRLREAYQAVRAVLDEDGTWESEYAVGGSMAILAHTAYHLGEIRQALCTVGR
jgi:hypothetical protein